MVRRLILFLEHFPLGRPFAVLDTTIIGQWPIRRLDRCLLDVRMAEYIATGM